MKDGKKFEEIKRILQLNYAGKMSDDVMKEFAEKLSEVKEKAFGMFDRQVLALYGITE